MAEFEDIVGDIADEHKDKGRMVLVWAFDRMPGDTFDDFNKLASAAYEANKDDPTMQNLQVSVLWGKDAAEVERLMQLQIDEFSDDDPA